MKCEINVVFRVSEGAHYILKKLKEQNDNVFLDVLDDGRIILSGDLWDMCQDFSTMDDVDDYLAVKE